MSEPTWTLSGFGDEIDPDPVVQVAVLQALGARHVEVRSAWGVNVIELDDARLARLSGLLAERGMEVSAIASPIGKVDVSLPVAREVDRLERAIDAAAVLGSRYIRLFSFYRGPDLPAASIRDDVMERMRALAGVAEGAGVTLLHENERDIYGDTPERCLDIVRTVDSPNLRLAWDSANFVQVGVSRPYDDGYAALRPHLEYLQVKDARTTGEVAPAGEGDGQLLETLTALRDDGYTGFASLEPHLIATHLVQADAAGERAAAAFGRAARALRRLTDQIGVQLA